MSIKVEQESKKSSMKEIKLTLQQTVTLTIDEQWTMKDIKQAAKKEYGHVADLFTIFIKDYEVTNLENINLLRTLDYYKSSTIFVVPRINKMVNEEENLNISINNSHSVMQNFDLLNSSDIHDKSRYNYISNNQNSTKEKKNVKVPQLSLEKNPENVVIRNKIDDAYSNLDKLKKTITDFNIRSELGLNKSYYKLNEMNSSQIIDNKNTSFNHIHSLDNITNKAVSSSMFVSHNMNRNPNFAVSPIRENPKSIKHLLNSDYNYQPYSKVDEIITNIKNKLNMPLEKVDHNLYSLKPMEPTSHKNDSFFSLNSPITRNPNPVRAYNDLLDRAKSSAISNINPSYLTENLPLKFPQTEEEFKIFFEDNRNIHLTNQILNKSNIELKNQLKRFEEEYESNSDLRLKIVNLYKFIENLKVEMSNLINSNEDVGRMYDMLKADFIELEKENESMKQKFHNVSENFFVSEKTNQNLKNGIERFEDALKNFDNEKSILSINLFEKDKQIFTLSEKEKNNLQLNLSLKKSLNDYEEMLGNMNRTIEILKKSSDDCEKEIFKLKCIIDEKNSLIENKKKEVNDKSKENSDLNNELNLIRSELKFFNEDVLSKLKILDELQEKNNDLSSECEKYKMKIQNLSLIIQEKENTVENMKMGYNALNITLEEIKKQQDEMKRKSGDDLIEKNRMLKEKKSNEEFNIQLENKIEDLLLKRNEQENEFKINKSTITQLEQENSKLLYNNQNLVNDNTMIKEKNFDNEKLIKSLEYKVGELDERYNKVRSELEDMEKKKNEFNSEKLVYESKLDEMSSKYENLLKKFNQNLAYSDELTKKYETSIKQNYKISEEKSILNNNYENLDKDFREIIKQANSKNPSHKIKNLFSSKAKNNQQTVNKYIKGIENESDSKYHISTGAKFIFAVYDNRSILSFNLEERKFKISEFADYSDFENNFRSEGSISLNVEDGLFIVTGDNHDLFYFYSQSKNTMNKLSKFRDNHAHGALIIDDRTDTRNSIICLSGWHNRKVERYYNDDLVKSFANRSSFADRTNKQKFTKNNEMSYLPEMIVERSESGYIFIDDKYLYAFFGYCCPKAMYMDTIEYLHIDNSERWETLKYSNEQSLSTFIKSHSLVKISNRDILIIGGYDGNNEVPVETIIKFDTLLSNISSIDRKLPDIALNHFYNFQKDSSFVPFIDVNERLHFTSIDDMDNVHVIDVKTIQYDIFKFD